MAQQPSPTVENHFIAGLKTEFTGLNFPENAATDTQNCVFTLIGDVTRRGGINYETNFASNPINVPNVARSTFRWVNAGGDGTSQILVQQIGNLLYFYKSSSATLAKPLSTTLLTSTVNLSVYVPVGSTANPALQECQYAIGNGYLFVFHPNCDPFYCVFNNGIVTSTTINLQIRDQVGIIEPGVADNFRPNALTAEHTYNLINQGWTQGTAWSGNGNVGGLSNAPAVGQIWNIPITSQTNTTTVTGGSQILVTTTAARVGANNNNQNFPAVHITGTVSSYTATTPGSVTVTVSQVDYDPNTTAFGFWSGGNFFSTPNQACSLQLTNVGFINTFKTAVSYYPSNSDIWWLYKDTSNVFNPATTFPNVQQLQSPAPKGTFILNVFNQTRSLTSNISGLTDVTTLARPSTGTFFQSRVWYSGVNAFFGATGDASNYTWTENIYFSQIVESPINFGRCYQDNDPTSQNLFAELPSDGGFFTIPGSGAIYKLFALRFGLLVFAANGIWFVSGSSGIGFTATDFTVTKISSIEAISGTSFIDVQGYPMFWNQEGIYAVLPSEQAGSAHSPDIQLNVQNLCLGTILSYYDSIPLISKSYVRGDYDQLNYIVQWVFRSTNETGIGDRYNYDTILNFNVVTKAFYPYSLPTNSISKISDIKYIQNPGGSGAPSPVFKYVTAISGSSFAINPGGGAPSPTPLLNNITFSEENDFTNWKDFISENGQGFDYSSYFVTGYKLVGQSLRKFQMPYLYLFSRNSGNSSVGVQSIWDYAGSAGIGVVNTNSGRWSTKQVVSYPAKNFVMSYRKIRLRGRGLAAQIKISSISGKPFDLMGWSVWNEVNMGI